MPNEFGDTFGFVNSLFSGLALAGVVIAVLLQSEELHLQRNELEDTREQLRLSAESQQKQSESLFLATYLDDHGAGTA